MPFKIKSAIVKKDPESNQFNLVDPDGNYNDKEILMVVDSDDLITMQLLINAILRNDFKAWRDVQWNNEDTLKSLLVKLGYGREEIVEMLKEF